MEKEFLLVEHVEPDLTHRVGVVSDDASQESALLSDTFLNSAFFSPESVLPPAFLLQHDEPEEIEREIPKITKRRIEIDEETPSPPSRIGLIASMSVGMLVAIFLFPMIRLAERSTRSFVTASFTSEIGRRVDQYEQINANLNNTDAEELMPINLALTGWKELRLETLMPFHEVQGILAPQEFSAFPLAHVGNEYAPAPISSVGMVEHSSVPSLLLLANTEGLDMPTPLNAWGVLDYQLLVILEQENCVRSAYGQYFHFKEGRVFFRELP